MQKKRSNKTKTALITGAGRRIGAEIARTLHADGMHVIVHYHASKKEAATLCHELNKKRRNSATALQADLSILSEVTTLLQQTVKIAGRLDVLVNNASAFYKTKIGKIASKEWDTLIDTNLKAPFFLAQAAFPHLAKQQGCIVNIADIRASLPLPDYSIYCISKAGLHMLTKTLARDLAPDVRVNTVSPGSILWPEGKNSLSPAMKKKITNRIALRRHGGAAEIAKTVLFLIRDTSYITGQDLAVDGGRLLF